MSIDNASQLYSILRSVQKPGRYVGGEWGQIAPKDDAALRFALCFPDTYEIGMSHLGLRILYGLINRRPDATCERVFAPWVDMEHQMRAAKMPLFTLESHSPVRDFDVLGFTLQYELCYTNVLNLLDLAGIALLAAERTDLSPLVIAGGPCTCNPEPLADFIDLFVLGEGEEVTDQLLNLLKEHKKLGKSKHEFLCAAAKLDGVYVPSLYHVTYNPDGTIAATTPIGDAPPRPRKAVVQNLDAMYTPAQTLVPYLETVHDRAAIELFRGCIRGCRFCQAGYLYRPIREKSPGTVDAQSRSVCDSSGWDELSLCSLSTSDYAQLPELLTRLLDWTEPAQTNLSLPSLRMDNFPQALMERIQSVRRAGLTFAPEAGTQRLRDVINKNLTEDSILSTARQAFAGGWTAVKLYFMLGLPTENDDDICGIAQLAQAIVDEYYHNPDKPKGKAVRVNISCACFVPKPFTPFQWEPQATLEELEEKQRLLRASLTTKKANIGRHNAKMGLLEGVFARGDRRLGAALLAAWRAGARFDSWDEHFDFALWQGVFEQLGLEMAFYANRRRAYGEVLPWGHLDFGLREDFLWQENRRAQLAEPTPNCRENCAACGAQRLAQCSAQKKIAPATPDALPPNTPTATPESPPAAPAAYRPLRLWLRKSGAAVFTAHLDMNRLFSRAVRRARLPLWYTEGFNPHPYLTFPLPLPLGQAGEHEPIDLRIVGDMADIDVLCALNSVLPRDVQIVDVTEPVHKANAIVAAQYRVHARFADEATATAFAEEVRGHLSAGAIGAEKRSKRGVQMVNLCEYIRAWDVRQPAPEDVLCSFTLDAGNTRNLNAQLLWDTLCAKIEPQNYDITRLQLLVADGDAFG